jgi:hypothetical protein
VSDGQAPYNTGKLTDKVSEVIKADIPSLPGKTSIAKPEAMTL